MRYTRRFIINSLNGLNLSSPWIYERYYINDNLRVQRKNNVYEEEILNNNKIKKSIISRDRFITLKENAYAKIIRNSYLYLDDDRISIKEYKDIYEGLIRVEINFENSDEIDEYQKEDWLGKEITNTKLAFDKDLCKLSKDEFKKLLEEYK